MDQNDLYQIFRSIEEVWSNFCISIEEAAEVFRQLRESYRGIIYAKESVPPKEYGTRRKKDWIFHQQSIKHYKLNRRSKKHQPYTRRIF